MGRGAMTQPPTSASPLPPPLSYVTSEKGMPFGFMNKKPRGVKFIGRRKVLRRQMFGALHSAHDRVHVEIPEN